MPKQSAQCYYTRVKVKLTKYSNYGHNKSVTYEIKVYTHIIIISYIYIYI